jgi:hypothetical protein
VPTYEIDNLIASGFALIVFAWLVSLIAAALRRSTERQHELRLRVLERCGPEDLHAVLQSREGREWLGRFVNGGLDSAELAGTTLQRGLTLVCVGMAAAIAAAMTHVAGGAALALGGLVAAGWGVALLAARWWLLRAAQRTPAAAEPARIDPPQA